MTAKRLRLCLAAAFLCGGTGAFAQPTLTLSGFGTAGVMHSDEDRADYRMDATRPSGAGYTEKWSPDVDSRVGLQLTTTFSPRLSAHVQVLARHRYDGTYKPGVEWANLRWEALPDLHLRVGRIVLPAFMVTDTRLVGYAYPWARPPVELYSMVPVTNSDGLDVIWRTRLGEVVNQVHFLAGQFDTKFPTPTLPGIPASVGEAKARNLYALIDTIERGPATFRVSYGETELTIDSVNEFLDAFAAFGPQGAAIRDRFDLRGRRVSFVGLGASYDPGPWFGMAEWARFNSDGALGKRNAWYVSGGARFGKLTVFATYARARPESPTSDPGLDLAFLPPEALPTAALLNALLNKQLIENPDQRTVSVGARWELLRNVAVKLQYDDVRLGDNSFGTFTNVQPGFEPGSHVRLFSAVVDFVF